MSKRRVFVGIPCPEDVRARISAFQEKWRGLPVRWIKPENLHLTLLPPSYFADDEIARAAEALRMGLAKFPVFEITFERFVPAPPGKPARMIWLSGKPSKELPRLRDAAAEALLAAKVPFAYEGARPLLPHITIARMHPNAWKRLEPKPDVEEQVGLTMPVQGVTLMESVLKRGGAEYAELEYIPLT